MGSTPKRREGEHEGRRREGGQEAWEAKQRADAEAAHLSLGHWCVSVTKTHGEEKPEVCPRCSPPQARREVPGWPPFLSIAVFPEELFSIGLGAASGKTSSEVKNTRLTLARKELCGRSGQMWTEPHIVRAGGDGKKDDLNGSEEKEPRRGK
ncbi:hypothetical protein E5288_WYG016955 [Bos mutus]|uniref:Uncharacterized protein n=1 Tax=Bos mutus TaxID=72004 RepID=A0A6B0RUR3_9CETA|nr:hypothetical protein [Bos mutus]